MGADVACRPCHRGSLFRRRVSGERERLFRRALQEALRQRRADQHVRRGGLFPGARLRQGLGGDEFARYRTCCAQWCSAASSTRRKARVVHRQQQQPYQSVDAPWPGRPQRPVRHHQGIDHAGEARPLSRSLPGPLSRQASPGGAPCMKAAKARTGSIAGPARPGLLVVHPPDPMVTDLPRAAAGPLRGAACLAGAANAAAKDRGRLCIDRAAPGFRPLGSGPRRLRSARSLLCWAGSRMLCGTFKPAMPHAALVKPSRVRRH